MKFLKIYFLYHLLKILLSMPFIENFTFYIIYWNFKTSIKKILKFHMREQLLKILKFSYIWIFWNSGKETVFILYYTHILRASSASRDKCTTSRLLCSWNGLSFLEVLCSGPNGPYQLSCQKTFAVGTFNVQCHLIALIVLLAWAHMSKWGQVQAQVRVPMVFFFRLNEESWKQKHSKKLHQRTWTRPPTRSKIQLISPP